jgi:ribosomal protein S27E
MSDFRDAVAQLPQVRCPGCGEERLVEEIAKVFFCQVCSKTFVVVPPK